jgi:hypothetical protein
MKNVMIVDIDTDRDRKILIGKSPDTIQPETQDEAIKMVNFDIICLTEALCELIYVADLNGYGSKDDYVGHATDKLKLLLTK